MVPDPVDPYTGLRNETPTERMDRNWAELLQELRVVQTGVQLLTAFLLTVPFQARFEELDRYQVTVYAVVLLLAVVALVLFIAPVGYHRALFRQQSKGRLVAAGTAFTKVGLAVLGAVVSGGVLLVVDVIGGRTAGWVAGGAVAALIALCWYVLPRRVLRQVLASRREQP